MTSQRWMTYKNRMKNIGREAKEGTNRPVLVSPLSKELILDNMETIKDQLPEVITCRKFVVAQDPVADRALFKHGMAEKIKEKKAILFIIRGNRMWWLRDDVIYKRWQYENNSIKKQRKQSKISTVSSHIVNDSATIMKT